MKLFRSILVGVVVLFLLFPFYWAFITSLKVGTELFSTDIIPNSITFENYISLLKNSNFGKNIFNSVIVATSTVTISLFLALTAAYALGRIYFKGRRIALIAILSISMFPQIAVLSGLFELIRSMGLYNNLFGLVLSYLIFTLPFTVWVLRTFMVDFPRELDEAAIMDGASIFTIIFKIYLPTLMPALIATGLLAFIAAWNEFLFALTFTLTDTQRTVPVAIAMISGASQHELPWGQVMAASMIVTVPLILLVLFCQKRIVSGLTAGAVKG